MNKEVPLERLESVLERVSRLVSLYINTPRRNMPFSCRLGPSHLAFADDTF